MAARKKVVDAVIRHRIDIQKFAKREAAAAVRLIGLEDAKLIQALRAQLGVAGQRNLKSILAKVDKVRGAQLDRVLGRIRGNLLKLAKSEGATLGRVFGKLTGTTLRPVRAAELAARIERRTFASAIGNGKSLASWWDDLAKGDRRRLASSIEIGIRSQQTTDQIVRTLTGSRGARFADGVLAITRSEAETAVRTATNFVANEAQSEWAKANEDVVQGNEWIALLDERTCQICEDLDGTIVPPGGDGPPAHPNCRCSLVPVFDLDALSAMGVG